jgi:hypothetical protein
MIEEDVIADTLTESGRRRAEKTREHRGLMRKPGKLCETIVAFRHKNHLMTDFVTA